MYYIRFTETIEDDIKRNTSILTNHDNLVVDGLCAFFGGNDIESTIKKARMLGKYVCDPGDTFAILKGVETNGKTGTLGTVITDIELISTHTL